MTLYYPLKIRPVTLLLARTPTRGWYEVQALGLPRHRSHAPRIPGTGLVDFGCNGFLARREGSDDA
ncbi:protein of unknown function [Nitrospira japonica]|uniref:Uncharacterized protein n=1 Tax=Nitrospira japonica TaxID=1325564 RepID=A0A1W1HZT5_9BACT|nr:protein of unknown function [Nitrospira japonica]